MPSTNPYTSVSISGLNANPPPDDGTTVAGNQIDWAADVVAEISTPLQNAITSINSNVSSFGGRSFNINSNVRNAMAGAVAYTPSELTIVSGVVTQARSHHTIDTQSDASTDDLDRLNNSSADAGTILRIRMEASGRIVTVKHNAGTGDGQIFLADTADYVMAANEVLTLIRIGTSWYEIARSPGLSVIPRGYIDGFVLVNGTDSDHDINISAGICRDSSDAATLALTSTLTKQIDATWAVGSNAGGLDTGSVANTTWYHIHIIRRSDTGVVDALFSTSVSSPTFPTNYDQSRRVGSVRTDSSANIIAFLQFSNYFSWDVPVTELSNGTINTAETLFSLSMPAGIRVIAVLGVSQGTASQVVTFYPPDQTGAQPGNVAPPIGFVGSADNDNHSQVHVLTNVSRQIAARASSALTDCSISSYGWYDFRGENA